MRKMRRSISLLLLFCIVVFSMNIFTKDKALAAGSVTISNQTLSLEVDHYKTLRLSGTTSKARWSSSNSAVASVTSDGKVFAKAHGTATITAYVSGYKLTCKVNVIYMKKAVTLTPGKAYTLTILGAKGIADYTTSDETVAEVSDTGVVTAKAPGNAVITAYVDDKILTSKITVIGLNYDNIVLELGGWSGYVKTLKISYYSGSVTWNSSNSRIASVSSDGKVKAQGYGDATITAFAAGRKFNCKVKVLKINTKEFTLNVNETKRLKIYGTTDQITWTSDDNTVAQVSADGTVSALSQGMATITGYVNGRKVTSDVYVTE